MREIAKLAGVSSATVSRVINGSNAVTDDTARRVREVIERVGFVPDSNATALKWGRSNNTFGIIIPDLTNPFFTDLFDCFEAIASEHDQDLLTANTRFHPKRVEACIRRMLMRRVDGVALLGSELDTKPIESLIRYQVPLVTLDRRYSAVGMSDVSINFEAAFDQAIQHLKSFGHRHIGFLGGSNGSATSITRREAFKGSLRKHKLPVNPEYIQEGDYRAEGGRQAMARLLTLKNPPTACLAANDLTALGALKLLLERGVDVPNHMSLIGFDDIAMCELVSPSLTSLRVSRPHLANLLYEALNQGLNSSNKEGVCYTIEATLIVRGSVTYPAKFTERDTPA